MKKIILLLCISILLANCTSAPTETSVTKETATDVFHWGKVSNGLQMGIRFKNDSLEIQLKYVGDSVINICTSINSTDLDWINIQLKNSNGIIRNLHIGEAVRTGSQMNTKTLKDKEIFSYCLDLKYWALQEINGRKKLADDKYAVSVSYKAQDCFYPNKNYWNGEVNAGPVVYEVSKNTFEWGAPSNNLQMGIRLINDSLAVQIKNIGDKNQQVCYIKNDTDIDWLTITLTNSKGIVRKLLIRKVDHSGVEIRSVREEIKALKKADSFEYFFDLNYWAKQEINESKPLEPDTYEINVSFKVNKNFSPAIKYWHGEMTAGLFLK